MIIIIANTPEEIEQAFSWLDAHDADVFTVNKVSAMTNAERQKKYRESKKRNENVTENVTNYEESVTKRNENVTESVTQSKEEREEKEAVSPLIPSSLSSSPLQSPINYPITPLSPLSEEKEEREEKFMAGVANRGALLPFGEYVKLSQKEYGRLCKDFGEQKANQMIQRMNSYIGEDTTGKLAKKYQTRNHNLTLRNWENKDSKAKLPKQIPKRDQEVTFGDIHRYFEQAETPQWDIDL